MYTLAVRRDFIARHALIGGDWGRENLPNSHRYRIELQLGGRELDEHGFLVDIVEVNRHLDAIVEKYGDQMLNDIPAFKDLNPSLEHFVRILAQTLDQALSAAQITELRVVLWEDEVAWAAYAARSS